MTPLQLKTAALMRMTQIAEGQDPPADDMVKMTEKYEALHAMLLKAQLVTWSLTEDIPTKCQEPIITMLCALAASDFGIAEPRYSRMRSEGSFGDNVPSLAEKQLRRVLSPTHIYTPLRGEYF